MTLTAFSLLIAAGVGAQTVYDAANITSKDLNGTARFVGMGGAMGALGGDISTIGSNPAGIGIYRSNDIMTTFGFRPMVQKVSIPEINSIRIKCAARLIILELSFLVK